MTTLHLISSFATPHYPRRISSSSPHYYPPNHLRFSSPPPSPFHLRISLLPSLKPKPPRALEFFESNVWMEEKADGEMVKSLEYRAQVKIGGVVGWAAIFVALLVAASGGSFKRITVFAEALWLFTKFLIGSGSGPFGPLLSLVMLTGIRAVWHMVNKPRAAAAA